MTDHEKTLGDWHEARYESAIAPDPDLAIMDLQAKGDALAVLVPQLLDRISGLEQLNEELVGEIHRLLDVQRAKRSFGD